LTATIVHQTPKLAWSPGGSIRVSSTNFIARRIPTHRSFPGTIDVFYISDIFAL
jgi:hypothetical protein